MTSSIDGAAWWRIGEVESYAMIVVKMVSSKLSACSRYQWKIVGVNN